MAAILNRQNRPSSKNCNKGQKRSLYNDRVVTHQEDITTVNIYAPSIGAPKYININRSERKN